MHPLIERPFPFHVDCIVVLLGILETFAQRTFFCTRTENTSSCPFFKIQYDLLHFKVDPYLSACFLVDSNDYKTFSVHNLLPLKLSHSITCNYQTFPVHNLSPPKLSQSITCYLSNFLSPWLGTSQTFSVDNWLLLKLSQSITCHLSHFLSP